MGGSLILETTFLVPRARTPSRHAGPGRVVPGITPGRALYLSFVVAGELAAGASLADRAKWEEFLASFHVLGSSADVSWEYGRAYRYLQDNGRLIGGNDLWIAATALASRMPVVTRNVDHYRRVPGLDVETY